MIPGDPRKDYTNMINALHRKSFAIDLASHIAPAFTMYAYDPTRGAVPNGISDPAKFAWMMLCLEVKQFPSSVEYKTMMNAIHNESERQRKRSVVDENAPNLKIEPIILGYQNLLSELQNHNPKCEQCLAIQKLAMPLAYTARFKDYHVQGLKFFFMMTAFQSHPHGMYNIARHFGRNLKKEIKPTQRDQVVQSIYERLLESGDAYPNIIDHLLHADDIYSFNKYPKLSILLAVYNIQGQQSLPVEAILGFMQYKFHEARALHFNVSHRLQMFKHLLQIFSVSGSVEDFVRVFQIMVLSYRRTMREKQPELQQHLLQMTVLLNHFEVPIALPFKDIIEMLYIYGTKSCKKAKYPDIAEEALVDFYIACKEDTETAFWGQFVFHLVYGGDTYEKFLKLDVPPGTLLPYVERYVSCAGDADYAYHLDWVKDLLQKLRDGQCYEAAVAIDDINVCVTPVAAVKKRGVTYIFPPDEKAPEKQVYAKKSVQEKVDAELKEVPLSPRKTRLESKDAVKKAVKTLNWIHKRRVVKSSFFKTETVEFISIAEGMTMKSFTIIKDACWKSANGYQKNSDVMETLKKKWNKKGGFYADEDRNTNQDQCDVAKGILMEELQDAIKYQEKSVNVALCKKLEEEEEKKEKERSTEFPPAYIDRSMALALPHPVPRLPLKAANDHVYDLDEQAKDFSKKKTTKKSGQTSLGFM